MAIDGKILLLGLVAAGGVLLIATKKAKAKAPGGNQPPGTVGPPLQGVEVPAATPGSVVVLPDVDDAEPEDAPPSIVVPSPLVVPPGAPPPFVPPAIFQPPAAAPPPSAAPPPAATLPPFPTTLEEAQQTLPGAVLALPQVATDILSQAGVPVAVPLPPQVTPPPAPPPPPPPPVVIEPPTTQAQADAEQPTELADDTELLLATMLGAEQTATWKRVEPTLTTWQRNRGLVADGKFGPKSALRLGQETGLLPIVRFWPTGSLKETAVPKFRNDVLALSATAEEPRRAQLVAAAAREKGQGFGSKQSAISPVIVFAAT